MYAIFPQFSVVKSEKNAVEEESEDDPVEDAALLDGTCEIKRDSVCVRFY